MRRSARSAGTALGPRVSPSGFHGPPGTPGILVLGMHFVTEDPADSDSARLLQLLTTTQVGRFCGVTYGDMTARPGFFLHNFKPSIPVSSPSFGLEIYEPFSRIGLLLDRVRPVCVCVCVRVCECVCVSHGSPRTASLALSEALTRRHRMRRARSSPLCAGSSPPTLRHRPRPRCWRRQPVRRRTSAAP